MSKARSWCFTLNNPSLKEGVYQNMPNVAYIIVGDEIGESGTPHHQGYVYFTNAISFKSVKKLLPEGCHIEQARGSPEQASIYCKKTKILYEHGNLPKQGKRNDIVIIKELINTDKNMNNIIDEINSYQALKCAEMIFKYREKKRNWKPTVSWFWGSSGTGKTKTAFEILPNAWVSGKNLKWWDGYDAHDDVIIDDFRGDFCTFHELLRILDRYPYRIETKGGSRELLAKRIIITAPLQPTDLYPSCGEQMEQLLRRIDEIKYFD